MDPNPMNISISLTPELIGLIKAKVESGRYTSTSEVVREGLRLLERADRLNSDRAEGLRQAWQDGITSGDTGPLDFAELRETARNGSWPLPAKDSVPQVRHTALARRDLIRIWIDIAQESPAAADRVYDRLH
jgi:antitoxin ParD1/3/4